VKGACSEVRDGMHIDWDVPIAMDDGVILRADVFRPPSDGKHPVLLNYGPYAKGHAFQDSRKFAWERMIQKKPEVAAGSSNKYQNWEVADPEKWVPDGYAIVRVDSRGTGRSPGYVDPWSPRETKDLYDCIEWAAAQEWCNGKVGLNGISYFAMNAWQVAALSPPHLAAVCAWEGAADHYRETCYHGGIFSEFISNWYPRAIIPVQHGIGERGPRSRVTGVPVAGPETLTSEQLEENRRDIIADALAHPFDDDYHKARTPELEKITVPFLSAANWGGQGIHPRGNFEVYMRAPSKQKWLEAHGDTHWLEFYTDYGVGLQKRFFGHFLKGEDTGWSGQPAVQLLVRHPGEKFVERCENEWPLARTQWTKFYLDPQNRRLSTNPTAGEAILSYDAMGEGLTFSTGPLDTTMEITGPVAAKLFASSSTSDADLFLILRVFAPDGSEVTFQGAQDPHTPIAQGWLRASHRKLDAKRSLPYRPFHTHDEALPLKPGEPAELDIEIWPTCIVVPADYSVALTIRCKDRMSLIRYVASAHLSMPIHATGRPKSTAARTPCTSIEIGNPGSCCR
jgi:predicted acyl esterase